jgi:hexosaminidase
MHWLLASAVASLLGGCVISKEPHVAEDAHQAGFPNEQKQLDVIPAPARVVPSEGVFAFRADTWISIPSDPGVARTALYFAELLRTTSGVELKVRQGSGTPSWGSSVVELRLSHAAGETPPEAYSLVISARRIVASASDPRGLFYAMVTLWELCTSAADASGVAHPDHIRLQAMSISDRPRLAWRGLMLDSARHFQSPEFVMRYIDWMALHKLNVLHWHLTDDQGWRLQIKKYPRLTEVGAWRVPAGSAAAADIDPTTGHPRIYGGFYSQDEVRRIVAHAAERNVTIVPEIDMPGHATAAIVAYPQLAAVEHPPTAVPADWGIYPNLYNVEEDTFAFLEDVLDEVMALFPGEYVHVGGDEAVKDQWKASPRVQARMRELHIADEQALQSYFMQRIEKHLNAHGRRLIGWDEILEGGIAKNATVMSWRGTDGALAAVAVGHDAVLSPWPTLYFDNRQGEGVGEPPGRGRVISLRDVYDFDPMPSGIAAGQRQHVLGLQANVWTEHLRTEDRVAYMTFPRAAAVAEVGWSPADTHDWSDFARRLPAEFARYRTLGLRYSEDALRPQAREPGPFERHKSQQLRTCTDKLVLSLEDDAPLRGERAVFLIDVMNPCWIFPSADLSRASTLQAAVGQVPFNFQIGKDREAIHLAVPQTAAGELEVHVDSCDGERIAVLPLARAVGNNAVTQLPSVSLPRISGRHDLCFRFTQRALDPLWALDWVQLRE